MKKSTKLVSLVLALAMLFAISSVMTVSAAGTTTVNIAANKQQVLRNETVEVTIVLPSDGADGILGGFKGTITYDDAAFTPVEENVGNDYFPYGPVNGDEPVQFDNAGLVEFVYVGREVAKTAGVFVAKVVFTAKAGATFTAKSFGFSATQVYDWNNDAMTLSTNGSVSVTVADVDNGVSGVTEGQDFIVGTDTLPTISWTSPTATATLNGTAITSPYVVTAPAETTSYVLVVTGVNPLNVTTINFTVTVQNEPGEATLTVKDGQSIRIVDYANDDWGFYETVIAGFEPYVNMVSELEGMFDYTGGTFKVYTASGDEAPDDILTTGMRVSIEDESGNELIGATIIIFGDTNYDGYLESPDLFRIIDGIDPYTEPFAFIAADLTFDFYVESPDVFALFDILNSGAPYILDFSY